MAEKRARDAIDLTEDASPEKKHKVALNAIAKEFICPITQELPCDPVMAKDGKIYEREAILEWFRKKDGDATSPSTGKVIDVELVPAVQVRNTIESLIESGAIEGEAAEAWQKKLEQEKEVKEIRAKAEGGDAYSMWRIGVRYRQGVLGLAENAEQARAWYKRSAAVRHPMGMAAFGEALLHGIGGSTDTSLGLVLVTEAAATNGSDFAAYTLGKAFLDGNFGLMKDPVRARFWLVKAFGECKHKHMSESGRANATRLLRELDAAE